MDISGYFVPDSTKLAYFPLAPCRILDTRRVDDQLGFPHLHGGVKRTFEVASKSSCNIPAGAQAYSLNMTAVPHSSLGYLTVWPSGQSQPEVSTLNAPTGTVTANATVVPAGTNGAIDVYATNDSDLVIDINGYFAPATAGGLSLHRLGACRTLDTRSEVEHVAENIVVHEAGREAGDDSGGGNSPGNISEDHVTLNPSASSSSSSGKGMKGRRDVSIVSGSCGLPFNAEAYVMNATVVPSESLGYLTLWPTGQAQPVVSTLNADDATVTANMAIVPAGTGTVNGSVSAYCSNTAHVLLDVFGYFAK